MGTIRSIIDNMLRGLALETSGRTGSLALVEDGAILAEETFSHGLKHAAEIVVRIDRLCRDRRWQPEDLRELYVSSGPGSFTGLRIGITLAKTLAFATGAKLVAVPTVQVLACNAPTEARRVLIVLDAKRDQIFTARLARDLSNDWSYEEPAHLDSLSAMLDRAPHPVYLIGEGIPYHQKFVPPDDAGILITPEPLWSAQARHVATIGWQMARAGQFTDPDRFTPLYIRKPEAEEKFEQSHAP